MGDDASVRRENDAVQIVPHRPEWSDLFEEEARQLEIVVGPWITGGVHHVGSTAVPGLAAKPIIDIAVGVAGLEASRPCIAVLGGIGYTYFPYRSEVMHWFCKPNPERRTHHLHLIPTGSPRFADELVFRDYLRTHAEWAREYAILKHRLAEEHSQDREEYTAAKAGFVELVTKAAHSWRADQIG